MFEQFQNQPLGPTPSQLVHAEQRADAAPIVENPALPRMTEIAMPTAAGPQLFMDTKPGTERRMDPLPQITDGRIPLTSLPEGRPIPTPAAADATRADYPDQQRRVSVVQFPES